MAGRALQQPLAGAEIELAALCLSLGARQVPGWTPAEERIARTVSRASLRAAPALPPGLDPLGEMFCRARTPEQRRPMGATYTPGGVVDAMIAWAAATVRAPVRVIDPGCGSGRFLVAAGRAFPAAELIGVEIDPLAALMARASIAAAGLADRASIIVADYREAPLARVSRPTLFIGNPPYVRHHDIGPRGKSWLSRVARARGLRASQLAGLHVHFFLATLEAAREGDVGCFITAAEWLDVNYGRLVRDLLVGPLGLVRLDILDPRAEAFDGALTTAVIAGFRVGSSSARVSIRVAGAAGELGRLDGGARVSRALLAGAPRWSHVLDTRPRSPGGGLVELGELCRVHRGQVTGANQVWIAGEHTPPLPASVLVPAITRARELFAAGAALGSCERLRRIIDLPAALDELGARDRALVERFLRWARAHGAHDGYIARHRSPWWAVRLREPAPILATYMARRRPAFVRNRAGARHINIAHGLYPREPMSEACLDGLAGHLARTASTADGRTYAGGLTKFEPREMERLLVPDPARLIAAASC